MQERIEKAKGLQSRLVALRRELHACAEVGFDLTQTVQTVEKYLKGIGVSVKKYGKSTLVACLGKGGTGRTILLRADMDGLPMYEMNQEEYACKTGNMHACGHDLHTTMLLGAATLLKEREKELLGQVKLLFQPAEEILQGAKHAIDEGAMGEPMPSAAFALHVSTGTPIKTGTFVISTKETAAPAADFFRVEVMGRSTHGATPHLGVDALLAASQMVVALQTLSAREQKVDDAFVLTVGRMQAGSAGNALAQTAVFEGTLRAYSESTRKRIKKRLIEICKAQAKSVRASVDVQFEGGCPTLKNNLRLSEFGENCIKELFGGQSVMLTDGRGGGSEDFAYISHKIPSALFVLSAGNVKDGYTFSLHHPKTRFDESVLWRGSALFAYFAEEWLKK